MKLQQAVAADVRRRTLANLAPVRFLTSVATMLMKFPGYNQNHAPLAVFDDSSSVASSSSSSQSVHLHPPVCSLRRVPKFPFSKSCSTGTTQHPCTSQLSDTCCCPSYQPQGS